VTPYTVEYHAKGAAEIVGLPADAFEHLTRRLVEVARDPWNTTTQDGPDTPAFRNTRFGSTGLVQVFIDDMTRVVRVHGIVWVD
jgi:hypothetical protein